MTRSFTVILSLFGILFFWMPWPGSWGGSWPGPTCWSFPKTCLWTSASLVGWGWRGVTLSGCLSHGCLLQPSLAVEGLWSHPWGRVGLLHCPFAGRSRWWTVAVCPYRHRWRSWWTVDGHWRDLWQTSCPWQTCLSGYNPVNELPGLKLAVFTAVGHASVALIAKCGWGVSRVCDSDVMLEGFE